MEYETIEDAAHAWVAEFNAYPNRMIEVLMDAGCEWEEVTVLGAGDPVTVCWHEEHGDVLPQDGTVIRHSYGTRYDVELEDGTILEDVRLGNMTVPGYEDRLPMWGTLWSFGNSIDDWWLEEKGGLQLMCDCGFRVYYFEDFGYFFGIDGCGYDFYEGHWIPLYKARGLLWHKGAVEELENAG